MRPMDGILLVDKERGRTSHEVVDSVKWIAGGRVGHLGSLDPIATGLLLVSLGRATRLMEYLKDREKVYEAEFELGVTTDTDDSEGQETARAAVGAGEAAVREALAKYVGTIEQRPPIFSAVKLGGVPSHKRARRGEGVEPVAREVVVHAIELLAYEPPRMRLSIRCGSGFYVRALARDLGRDLGCGGIMTALRRVRIGSMRVEEAVREAELTKASIRESLWPMDRALDFLPSVELDAAEAKLFAGGRRIDRQVEALVRVQGPGGFIGIGRSEGGLQPDCVMYGA